MKTRVFISSTIRDLHYVRNTLATRIENEMGHDVVISESTLFDWTEDIVTSCKRNIEESDIYVLIIGENYGSTMPGSDISITREEYRHAKKLGKPIFALCKNETWVLYTSGYLAKDDLESKRHLASFLDEVGASMAKNIYSFTNAEQAYGYIKDQLSILFHQAVRSLQQPSHDIMGDTYKSLAHFNFHLVKYSKLVNSNYDRILAVFSEVFQTGDIVDPNTNQAVLTLSKVTGATLFQISPDQTKLIQIGAAGNTSRNQTFDLNDPRSYVSVTYGSKTMFLSDPFLAGIQLQYIMCIPVTEEFVLAVHFYIERTYGPSPASTGVILDDLLQKNEMIFGAFQTFLEGGSKYVGEPTQTEN